MITALPISAGGVVNEENNKERESRGAINLRVHFIKIFDFSDAVKKIKPRTNAEAQSILNQIYRFLIEMCSID
jgi:hypothetical protein